MSTYSEPGRPPRSAPHSRSLPNEIVLGPEHYRVIEPEPYPPPPPLPRRRWWQSASRLPLPPAPPGNPTLFERLLLSWWLGLPWEVLQWGTIFYVHSILEDAAKGDGGLHVSAPFGFAICFWPVRFAVVILKVTWRSFVRWWAGY